MKILPKPTLIPKKKKGFCWCNRVFVVEATRQLECQQCGRVISPFDYLMKMGEKQSNIDISVKILIREKASLEKEVADLIRQRRNLKAQIRRACKKNDTKEE